MGALHEGHIALIRRARKIAGRKGTVAVSIFVNPLQFGPKEDFSRYPRPTAADRKICAANGVDLVFAPTVNQMYGSDFSTTINENTLSTVLCGRSRPGHFGGVCTVVAKLFHILAPNVAVFGLKDFQQFTIIKRMVRDLNMPIRLVGVETVRERDGLAVSSRNRYLNFVERRQAPLMREALLAARRARRAGESRAASLRRIIIKGISSAPLARIDYVAVVDAETLQPVDSVKRNALAAVAVFFRRTRLIDNIRLA
jgi:pantoate--beta-alanine ligase